MAAKVKPKGDPTTVDRLAYGLRGHINCFSHVVINVSDLDRSVEFYEKTFPVQRWGRINGPVQSYLGPVETWDMGEFGESKVVIFRDPDGIMLKLIE